MGDLVITHRTTGGQPIYTGNQGRYVGGYGGYAQGGSNLSSILSGTNIVQSAIANQGPSTSTLLGAALGTYLTNGTVQNNVNNGFSNLWNNVLKPIGTSIIGLFSKKSV